MTSLITKKKDNSAETSEKNEKYYMVEEEVDDVRVDNKTINNNWIENRTIEPLGYPHFLSWDSWC